MAENIEMTSIAFAFQLMLMWSISRKLSTIHSATSIIDIILRRFGHFSCNAKQLEIHV